MTEADWLTCDDFGKMLNSFRGRASDRKLRLLAAACCRSIWELAVDERSRQAVLMAERLAEGMVTREECEELVREASAAIASASSRWQHEAAFAALTCLATFGSEAAAVMTANRAAKAVRLKYRRAEQPVHRELARDVFGNPFHPVVAESRWLTSDVLALARGIYEDRAFDRLPVLADALMDAGCDDEQVIGHCRGEGPHVRGCWAVDLLLGKA